MARKEFFESICSDYQFEDLKKIQTAYWFSKVVHRSQKRDDGERYFEHPLRVAKLLLEAGYNSSEVITTALLHDVIEDTFTPEHVIITLFGQEVWNNLMLLTKTSYVLDPLTLEMRFKAKKDLKEYFDAIANAKKEVRLVKVCDRIDNIRDIDTFKPERKAKYIKETTEYILPIAKKTDPVLVDKINYYLTSVS